MITCSFANIIIKNNVTWQDAFRFGVVGDTTWSFTGQSFIMELKASSNDAVAIYTLRSSLGTIVVDDAVKRVLHFNVPQAAILANLPVAKYTFDLVMFDASVPPVRVLLLQGTVDVQQGVSES